MLLPKEPYPVLREPYPVSTEPAAAPNPLAGPATATTHLLAPRVRPRILLVDDNENDILLTRRSLEKQDCEVVSASSVQMLSTGLPAQLRVNRELEVIDKPPGPPRQTGGLGRTADHRSRNARSSRARTHR